MRIRKYEVAFTRSDPDPYFLYMDPRIRIRIIIKWIRNPDLNYLNKLPPPPQLPLTVRSWVKC